MKHKKHIFLVAIVIVTSITLFLYPPYQQAPSHDNMAWIPAGEFTMGSNGKLAHPNEKPAHKVYVDGFWMDKTDVTNAEFAKFIKATGYVTTAEKKPDWETLKVQLPEGTPKPQDDKLIPGAMVFVGSNKKANVEDWPSWWAFVPGADWQHSQGPGSTISGKENHPVVQVSYADALAYAKWSGKRLPTEAEWEYAARGGLDQATYSWGDEFRPKNDKMANTYSGKQFPIVDPAYKKMIGTTKVASYPANGYGLYDMAGNVWQWTADWYRVDAFALESQQALCKNPKGPDSSFDPVDQSAPPYAPRRVIRGGSFLCDENFCMSYRPSARRGNDPYNPMAHIGFRLVTNK